MKINTLKSIVAGAGSLMALVVSPIYAGQDKSVGWDSQSGCESGTTANSVETGTPAFRTAIDTTLGKIEILREGCPDVHLTIKEPTSTCVPPDCGGDGG